MMLCQENIERIHDENEREAMYAIMYAAASRGKKGKGELPSVEDLYSRPGAEARKAERAKAMIEEQERTKEFLAKYDLTKLTNK